MAKGVKQMPLPLSLEDGDDDEKVNPHSMGMGKVTRKKRKRGAATTALSPVADGTETPPLLTAPPQQWTGSEKQRRHSNYHLHDEVHYAPGILLLRQVFGALCPLEWHLFGSQWQRYCSALLCVCSLTSCGATW